MYVSKKKKKKKKNTKKNTTPMALFLTEAFRYAEADHDKKDFLPTSYFNTKKSCVVDITKPFPLTFSPYQIFASRSFLNAVTPWLVMTQCTAPRMDKAVVVEPNPYNDAIALVSYVDIDYLGKTHQKLLIDANFFNILVDNAPTLKFAQRLTFYGLAGAEKFGAEKQKFTDEVIEKMMTTVDFHCVLHLDLHELKVVTPSFLFKITSPKTSLFSRRCSLVQSLDLSDCPMLYDDGATTEDDAVDQLSQVFATSFPHLKHVALKNSKIECGIVLTKALGRVPAGSGIHKSLEVFCFQNGSIHSGLFKFFSHCTKLKKIIVANLGYNTCQLTSEDKKSSPSFVQSIIKSCPIEVLDIHESQQKLIESEDDLVTLCKTFGNNLKVLEIGRTVSKLSSKFFTKTLFADCPFLMNLGMDDVKGLDVDLLHETGKNLVHLLQLDISDNYAITKKDRKAFQKKFPQITVHQTFYDTTSYATTDEEGEEGEKLEFDDLIFED